ncbi:hypothetical protein [Micromonospora matsumotoense]|uniref:hypothetical protein n=1 Tax=Micromonospora matsumotoense TaxID=121616 RepID=UPI00340D594F
MTTKTMILRRRSTAAGVLAAALAGAAIVLPASSAHADEAAPSACPPDSYYYNITSLGNDHVGVGPDLYVRNQNPTSTSASFTSQVAGSVSVTASFTTTISGGISLGVINADASTALGIATSYTLTASTGITAGPMTVPANKIQWASYGVNIRKTKGTFGREYSNCTGATTSITLAKHPTGVGWKLWQTSI